MADMLELHSAKILVQAKRFILEVGHPQIRQSIEIEIAQVSSHRSFGSSQLAQADPAQQTSLSQLSVHVLVEEFRGRVVADIHIDVAVEVEVRDQRAHPLAAFDQSHFGRAVSKSTRAIRTPDGI